MYSEFLTMVSHLLLLTTKRRTLWCSLRTNWSIYFIVNYLVPTTYVYMNQLLWCSVAYTHACTVLPEGPISRGLLTTFAPFRQSRQHRPPHRDSLTTGLQTGQGRKAALGEIYSCLMKARQSAFMSSGAGILKIFLGIIESRDLSSGGIQRMCPLAHICVHN